MTLRNQETKRLGITTTAQGLLQLAGPASTVFYSEPLDNLVQGATAEGIVGREITLKGLNRNFGFYTTGTINPDQPRRVRIMCLKIDPYLTASTLLVSQLFVQATTPDVGTWVLRTDKEPLSIIQKVYHDRTIDLKLANIAGQSVICKHKAHVNLHNMRFYRGSNTIQPGANYDIIWVLVSWVPGNVSTAANVIFSSEERIYYKDG